MFNSMALIRRTADLDINEIVVETRKSSKIKNTQILTLTSHDISEISEYDEKYRNGFQIRGKPTGIFNCHGLTFASRRTRLYDTEDLFTILKDDNYIEVEKEDVIPGDIIIYFLNNPPIFDDPQHSGIVMSKPEPPLYNYDVLSKWGCYKEVIHPYNNCPYIKECSRIRFYRIIE